MIFHYGDNLKLSIFGASHAPEIGMELDGIPFGLPVDMVALQCFMDRRAPGQQPWATSRKEGDVPYFQSGLTAGCTNGQAIRAVIINENIRRGDYATQKHIPRPGHADFTAWMKYGLDFDMSGGGPFSGRMTAPMCIAGGLCKQWLEQRGIRIGAHIGCIGHIDDNRFDPLTPNLEDVQEDFPVLNRASGQQMQEAIAETRQQGDSLGGIIECAITGLPAGMGGPMFEGIEGKLAHMIYGIPAVKGIEFGLGFALSGYHGSKANDPYAVKDGRIIATSNHCGGILGGISTGMPIIFRVAFKPTPSISMPQASVNMATMEEVTMEINGRHDPCIVPRAVPVVEAAAAIAIYDLILGESV